MNAYGVDSDSWTETGITWNNAPVRQSTELSTTNINDVIQYYDFDVTSYVEGQFSGDKIVTLVLEDINQTNKNIVLNSRENSFQPELIITY